MKRCAFPKATGVGMEATHLAVERAAPGVVFLKLRQEIAGKIVWQRFMELTPDETTAVITKLCRARNEADLADTHHDLKRVP